MSELATRVKRIQMQLVQATREIMDCGVALKEIRDSCNHVWRFEGQINAYHEHEWNVTLQCTECNLKTTERKLPVCEKCLHSLVRAKKTDRQAIAAAKKRNHNDLGNPPLAFRCPKCKKIHVLWHEGD